MAVNRFAKTHVAKYKPLTMEEVLQPAMMLRQREDQLAEQYAQSQSALGEIGFLLDKEPDDSILKTNYNQYNSELSSAWDNIVENGVTANSLRKAMDLKGKLSSVIKPVILAKEAHNKDSMLEAEVLSKDPTAVVEKVSQRNLDYYVNNGYTPTGVKSVSGDTIAKQTAELASIISKLQNQPEITSADISQLSLYGVSPEEAEGLMMLIKSTSGLSFDTLEGNAILDKMINNVMRRNGVIDSENNLAPWIDSQDFEKLYQSAVTGSYFAVGPTSYNVQINPLATRKPSSTDSGGPTLESAKGTVTLGSDVVPNYDVSRRRPDSDAGAITDDMSMAVITDTSNKVRELSQNITDGRADIFDENTLNVLYEMQESLSNVDNSKSSEKLKRKLNGAINNLKAYNDAIVKPSHGITIIKNVGDLLKEYSSFATNSINAGPVIEKVNETAQSLGMDRREYYATVQDYSKSVGGGKTSYAFTVLPHDIARRSYGGTQKEVLEMETDTWRPKGSKKRINLDEGLKDKSMSIVLTPQGTLIKHESKNGIVYYKPAQPDPVGEHVGQSTDIILSPDIRNPKGVISKDNVAGFESFLKNSLILSAGNNSFTPEQINQIYNAYITSAGSTGMAKNIALSVLSRYTQSAEGNKFIVDQPNNPFNEDVPQIVELSVPVSHEGKKGYMVFRGTLDHNTRLITQAGMFSTLDTSPNSFKNMTDYSQNYIRRNVDAIVKNTNPSTTD